MSWWPVTSVCRKTEAANGVDEVQSVARLSAESTFEVKMPLAFTFVLAGVYSREGRTFQLPHGL